MNGSYPIAQVDLLLSALGGLALTASLLVALMGWLLRRETQALRKLMETLIALIAPARLVEQERQIEQHEQRLNHHETRIARLEGRDG